MPKNKVGGKKFKRSRKGTVQVDNVPLDLQDYPEYRHAVVVKRLGGQWLTVFCSDQIERKCYIRGSFRNRVWMNAGDILLISLREQLSLSDKCDVVHKYTPEQLTQLESLGCLDFIRALNNEEDEKKETIFMEDDHYLDFESI